MGITVKAIKNIVKATAIVQAVAAPALMVVGHITGNTTMRNVGAVWCAWVTIDTARTVPNAIDSEVKLMGLDDDHVVDHW
jgi:hypothetical protein